MPLNWPLSKPHEHPRAAEVNNKAAKMIFREFSRRQLISFFYYSRKNFIYSKSLVEKKKVICVNY